MKKKGEFVRQKERNRIRQIIFEKAKLANGGAEDQWVTVGNYRCLLLGKAGFSTDGWEPVYAVCVVGWKSDPFLVEVFPRRKSFLSSDEDGNLEGRFKLNRSSTPMVNRNAILCYVKEMHRIERQ